MSRTTRVLSSASLRPALIALIACAWFAPTPSSAQGGLFDQIFGQRREPRTLLSPDGVADGLQRYGFRVLREPYPRGDVYVADVVDGLGRQQRLIVSARTGEVIERFIVENGDYEGSIPRPPEPIPNVPTYTEPQAPSRRLADIPSEPPSTAPAPHAQVPIPKATPIKPPRHKAAVAKREAPKSVEPPSVAVAPAPRAPEKEQVSNAPPKRRGRRDPLALPGSVEEDEAAVKAAKSAPSSADKPVPVAPLD